MNPRDSAGGGYKDAEFMRRFGKYVESKRAFLKAMNRAADQFYRKLQAEQRSSQSASQSMRPGPRRQQASPAAKPPLDLFLKNRPSSSPRPIDLGLLNMLRRDFEQAAYRYFSYRPGIQGPRLSDSQYHRIKGYFKDQQIAQQLGMDERGNEFIMPLKNALDKCCQEICSAYQRGSYVDARFQRAVVEAAKLVQLSGISTNNTERLMALLQDIVSG
jgi:hypothetical protein